MASQTYHPVGVNAFLLDGSVRFMKTSVHQNVWRALGIRCGGEVIISSLC